MIKGIRPRAIQSELRMLNVTQLVSNSVRICLAIHCPFRLFIERIFEQNLIFYAHVRMGRKAVIQHRWGQGVDCTGKVRVHGSRGRSH